MGPAKPAGTVSESTRRHPKARTRHPGSGIRRRKEMLEGESIDVRQSAAVSGESFRQAGRPSQAIGPWLVDNAELSDSALRTCFENGGRTGSRSYDGVRRTSKPVDYQRRINAPTALESRRTSFKTRSKTKNDE